MPTKRILESKKTLLIIFKVHPADFPAIKGNSLSASDLCLPSATQQLNGLKVGLWLVENRKDLNSPIRQFQK